MSNPENLPEQPDLIHSTDWDYLLLLDDFRYDFFEELWADFIDYNGELKRVWSAGSHTLHWLGATWPDQYDIMYVSGHAIANSDGIKGMLLARQRAAEAGVDPDYIPAEHFAEIIDVWDDGYVPSIETVPPDSVNDELISLETDKQVLAHYVQPHFPWVRSFKFVDDESELDLGERRDELKAEPTPGNSPKWSRGNIQEHFGLEGVKFAYRDNCKVALDGVNQVLPDIEGTVIVTSDHGEILDRKATHPPGRNDPELRTVPWLELEV